MRYTRLLIKNDWLVAINQSINRKVKKKKEKWENKKERKEKYFLSNE